MLSLPGAFVQPQSANVWSAVTAPANAADRWALCIRHRGNFGRLRWSGFIPSLSMSGDMSGAGEIVSPSGALRRAFFCVRLSAFLPTLRRNNCSCGRLSARWRWTMAAIPRPDVVQRLVGCIAHHLHAPEMRDLRTAAADIGNHAKKFVHADLDFGLLHGFAPGGGNRLFVCLELALRRHPSVVAAALHTATTGSRHRERRFRRRPG